MLFHYQLETLDIFLQANNGERLGDSVEGVAGRQDDGHGAQHKARGFPRILKAGHGIKLGAVVSEWGEGHGVTRPEGFLNHGIN